MKALHRPDLFSWSQFDEARNLDFHSVAWIRASVASPGYEHFSRLKSWIAGAYYSSPIGLKEQGWDGWAARGTFMGCEHQPGEHKNA